MFHRAQEALPPELLKCPCDLSWGFVPSNHPSGLQLLVYVWPSVRGLYGSQLELDELGVCFKSKISGGAKKLSNQDKLLFGGWVDQIAYEAVRGI